MCFGLNLRVKKYGLNLAFTGNIKDEILDIEEIAYYLVKYLLNNYADLLCQRYKLNREQIDLIMQNTENDAILEIMTMIGKTRGALVSRWKCRYE